MGANSFLNAIQEAESLRLFLDYDGTLADFAETPDEIHPDQELIDLLKRLIARPGLQLAIISGRRLDHIRKLIPLQGILLAGTYGIEMQDQAGRRIDQISFESIRPYLDKLLPQWLELIQPYQEMYLEDKGWSLALHAKFLSADTASEVLEQARKIIQDGDFPAQLFRLLGGHKFLEIAPRSANKGFTVRNLLISEPLQGALPIYIGDDDKDEEAFEAIIENSGVAIKVGSQPGNTLAQAFLESPQAVREFLASLLKPSG
jgi:trehalose 6-phosphate phosphatase